MTTLKQPDQRPMNCSTTMQRPSRKLSFNSTALIVVSSRNCFAVTRGS